MSDQNEVTYKELVKFMTDCTGMLATILLYFKGPKFVLPSKDSGHEIHKWQIEQINEVLESRGEEIIDLLQKEDHNG